MWKLPETTAKHQGTPDIKRRNLISYNTAWLHVRTKEIMAQNTAVHDIAIQTTLTLRYIAM